MTNVAVATCDLCGQNAGRQPLEKSFDGVPRAFCCHGCVNVYTILHESGVTDFRNSDLYRQSLALGLIAQPVKPSLDAPEAESREALYQLSGLWCASCGWLIEYALKREYGVLSAEVLFTSDLLKVRYCPQYIEPDRIPKRVESLGYGITEYGSERPRDAAEWRDLLLRIGIAGGLWMNVMLFSLVVYASYFEGIASWAQRAIPFVLMGLTTPAVFYSAWPILRIAAYGLREGVVRMETLISTGILAAYGYSVAQAFLGGKHFYFDTACAIVTLVLAGKAMERAAREKTTRSISMLYRTMPRKARVIQGGKERFVAVEAVDPGTTVLVKPGERIPVDGQIVEGSSSVDESLITGESEPRSRVRGDEVIGGSLNGAGVLEIRTTRRSTDSTLARIVQSVESGIANRTAIERSVDRVSRWFVPAVMAIALTALTVFVWRGLDTTEALMRSIAVLVIACPCALGIATPLATTAAVGSASRRGILIRDSRVLETFRSVDMVIFDKTGTVTEGNARVRGAVIDDEALELLSELEAKSEHPLARAIVDYAGNSRSRFVRDVVVHTGKGISGVVNGADIVAGSMYLIDEKNVKLTEDLLIHAHAWEDQGLTVVWCAIDGHIRGALALGDTLRKDARALIDRLRLAHVRTSILSGDSTHTTARVASLLGVDDAQGGMTPAEKARVIAELRKSGRVVAMVGDGINDAPALAAADIGIAMGSGTDLAMQAAPVVLMSDTLDRVGEAFEIAHMTSQVVRQNLFWAFFYNSAGISLAVAGVLNPILAAGAMVISSLSVIGNSLRLEGRIGEN